MLPFVALIFTVKVRLSPSTPVASPVPSLSMPTLSDWASAGLAANRPATRSSRIPPAEAARANAARRRRRKRDRRGSPRRAGAAGEGSGGRRHPQDLSRGIERPGEHRRSRKLSALVVSAYIESPSQATEIAPQPADSINVSSSPNCIRESESSIMSIRIVSPDGNAWPTRRAPAAPSGGGWSAWPAPRARRGRDSRSPGRAPRSSGAATREAAARRRITRPLPEGIPARYRRQCPDRFQSSGAPGGKRVQLVAGQPTP